MNKTKHENIEPAQSGMDSLKRTYHSPQLFTLIATEIQSGVGAVINEVSGGALTGAS